MEITFKTEIRVQIELQQAESFPLRLEQAETRHFPAMMPRMTKALLD